MNALRGSGLGAALLFAGLGCASASGADPQPAAPTPVPGAGPAAGAAAGETVYLIEHRVRPERRDQFEQFVHDVLMPAFQQNATEAGRPVQRVRLLVPQTISDDGSFTYTFLLDPAVPGDSYNVLDVLRAAHGDEEALRHYGLFTATWADDFTTRQFIQAR